jgi:hypothetical protein
VIHRLLHPVLLALLVGCSPATIAGAIGGEPVATDDVIFERRDEGFAQHLTVTIGGPSEGLCDDLRSRVAHPGGSSLVLDLSTDHLATGRYVVGPRIGAALRRLDSSCAEVAMRSATAGHVVLESIDGEEIAGSFQLEFELDVVEGRFSGRACNAPREPATRCEPL